MAHLDLILLVAAVNHTVSESGGEKKGDEKKIALADAMERKNFSSRACAPRHIKNTSK